MAKQEEISLWIRLKDGVTNAMKGIKSSFVKNVDAMKQSALVFAGAFAAIGAAIYKSVKDFGVQEDAITTLNQALKNNGNYSEAAAKDLQAYASELQKVTRYGDETILKSQALIASFGFEGEQLKSLTRATLDLAAAKGMDLKNAADLVAKAVGSDTNALSRYGVVIDGAAGSTQRAESAVRAISNLFGGQAEAQAKTFAGSVVQMQNALGDVSEKIGEALVPLLQSLTKIIKSAAEKFQEIYPRIKDLIVPITVLVGGIGALMTALVGVVTVGPAIAAAFAALTGPIGLTVVAISGATAAFLYFKNSNSDLALTVRSVWGTIGTTVKEYAGAVWNSIENLGKIFNSFGNIMRSVVTGQFKEAANGFKEMSQLATDSGQAFVDASEKVKETFKANLEAEKEAMQASREAKLEDNEIRNEIEAENNEVKLEIDQELLDRKAELEQIAEDARREFEEQKKQFDQMSAADRLTLIKNTLGQEKILKTAAQVDELMAKGKHEEAKRVMDELYKEAFLKMNDDMLKTTQEKWRQHWDVQVAEAVIGSKLSKEQYKAMGNFYEDILTVMGKKSIAAFRLMQGVAIVDTLVSTYEGAQKAYASLAGIPIVGPGLGIAAAGVAVAAGLARVDNIRRQQPPQAATGAYAPGDGATVRIGERNNPEWVMNQGNIRSMIDEMGGGSQIINLQMDNETIQTWIIHSEAQKKVLQKEGRL